MRILLLAPQPFYIDRGTPIDVDILARALSRQGHEVDLVCYPDGEDRSYTGLRVHRVEGPGFLRGTPPGFTWRKVLLDLSMVATAFGLARRHRYDVVHAGEEAVFIAMLLERVWRIPYVFDMDSSTAQQMVEQLPILGPFAPVFNWVEARAIRGALATAPVCNALADLARERGARHVETLHDISQLRDPNREATGFLKEQLGIEGPIFMYVGNLQPYQGVDLLLEGASVAIGRGTAVHVVIAGGSPENIEKYRRLSDRLGTGDRVHFLGPWPNDRLDELLAEADVLTAPRIKGVNTPMKVFPYMHTGKPVLVTDLITHNQILDSSVAVLAPATPRGFADAIQQLAEDPELRQRIGREGKAFIERNHTFTAHDKRVERLYRVVQNGVRARGRGRGAEDGSSRSAET